MQLTKIELSEGEVRDVSSFDPNNLLVTSNYGI